MSLSTALPPLILHPFADAAGPDQLVESSRASLMIQGLLPSGERSAEDLDRALLDGRYCEIRMLYYVGKDLARWIDQCMEHIERQPEYAGLGIREQSLAAFLVNDTPPAVQVKLRKWGVADYKAIFSRALGLNAMWALAPSRESLNKDFVRNYYRFADQMFACHQSQVSFHDISGLGFEFDIYASGEYSKMLEREWAETEVRDEN
ncbi:MAG TPA: hypothetical protein VK419_07530 [Bryobacteraceae bacterium]|nr:hypothetical protein [Bryobacteraceae bacterium]